MGNGDRLDGTFGSTYDVPITICAALNRDATRWAETAKDGIVAFGDDTTDLNTTLQFVSNRGSADQISQEVWNDSGSADFNDLTFTDGDYDDTWVLVCAVYTADNDRDVYIEDSTNTSADTSSVTFSGGLDEIRVGGVINNDFNNQKGLIASVGVWDVALSTSDIDALQTASESFACFKNVQGANLIGYWTLDTDQATHADESGNGGPTLTVQSSMPYSSDNPTIAECTSGALLLRRRR